jgi:hypothetical protein
MFFLTLCDGDESRSVLYSPAEITAGGLEVKFTKVACICNHFNTQARIGLGLGLQFVKEPVEGSEEWFTRYA